MYIARDCEEAINFLRQTGEHKKPLISGLVLLDLKMPKIDGFGVLTEIRKDDNLKSIPVIVLKTSGKDQDVERAYSLGCNSYIVKLVSFEKFIRKIIGIKKYLLFRSYFSKPL